MLACWPTGWWSQPLSTYFQPLAAKHDPTCKQMLKAIHGCSYRLSSWPTVTWRAWGASFSIAALKGDGGNTRSGPAPKQVTSSPPLLQGTSPRPANMVPSSSALAYPFSRRTIRARSTLQRNNGVGQDVGMVGKHAWRTSQAEDSPHRQSLLLVQAHLGFQVHPV